jgi:hypothetical protein
MFGIGTQADNSLNASNILELTTSASRRGPGLLTATYNGKTLPQSYIDSGTSDYFFVDTSLPACTQSDLSGFYCPTMPIALSPILTGSNGVTASGAFTLYNPNNVAASSNVAPGLGLNPAVTDPSMQSSASFVFGIPFYFGHTVYTAIEGSAVGNVQGPFLAY